MTPQPDFDTYTGWAKWDTKKMFVPFRHGHMQSYPQEGFAPNSKVEWRYVEPFTARMSVDHTERGRSSVLYWLLDEDTGIMYPISFSNFHDIFLDHTWEKGTCHERITFSFKKQGSNYFIYPLDV